MPFAIISTCIVAGGCVISAWGSISGGAFLGIGYAHVVAGSYAVMYQAHTLASKKGQEIIEELIKLGEADSPKIVETGEADTCKKNLQKTNSAAIRLDLFQAALPRLRRIWRHHVAKNLAFLFFSLSFLFR